MVCVEPLGVGLPMSLLVNYSHVSGQNTTPLSPDTIDGVTVEPGALIRGYGLLNGSWVV